MVLIKNMQINVEKAGNGRQNIILLHGWGQSTKAFKEVQENLQISNTVYNVDLPGFGKSDQPTHAFNSEDYADFLSELIKYYYIESPIIIGHSFGGRVAIKYCSKYNQVSKLILVDSAGIVHRKSYKYFLKIYYYKFLKRLYALPILRKYKNKFLKTFGSEDYKNANILMRNVLVKVVNEDLRGDLEKIKCPTLLVWGTNDTTTPISDAYIMKQHLFNAGIVKIENAGHYAYLENLYLFLKVINVFLESE